MPEKNNIPSYSAVDIDRYHKGLMSPAERHALEKAALEDPFLADALEGYMESSTAISADLDELGTRLHERIKEKNKLVPIAPPGSNWSYLRIAAVLLLVAGAGWLFYQYNINKQSSLPIASNENRAQPDSSLQTPSVVASPENHLNDFTRTDTVPVQRKLVSKKADVTEPGKPVDDREAFGYDSRKDTLKFNALKDQAEAAGEKKEAMMDKKVSGLEVQKDSETVVTGYGLKRSAVAPSARGSMGVSELSAPIIGWDRYQKYLSDSLRRPSGLQTKPNSQFVELSFQVDAEGKPFDFHILSSFSKAAAEEAWRLVSQGPLWKPGKGQLKIYF